MLFNNNSLRSVGALGLIMVVGASHAAPQKTAGPTDDPKTVALGRRLLAERNARFVENKGQWAKEARFLARGQGLNLWYTDHGIRYEQSRLGQRQSVDMVFVGGHSVRPSGVEKTRSQMSVYHANVAVKGISSYRELMSKDVLPGVSMRSYYDGALPRYDLIVAPGTKPSAIRLAFHGANGLSVKGGNLDIRTRVGDIAHSQPVAYQTIAGRRVPVAARWTVANGTAGFRLGAYDASRPLVIDPVSTVFGTYFGSQNTGTDEIRAVVKDPVNGAIIIAGDSDSPEFPSLPGQQPVTPTLNPDNVDGFLTRFTLDASGNNSTVTDFSFLFGGNGDDAVQYLRIDARSGDVWVAGTTITANNEPNSFPSSQKRVVTGGNPMLQRDVIGSNPTPTDGSSRTNFFVARLHHLSSGALDFGKDPTLDSNGNLVPDPANPRYATVLGTGIMTRSSATAQTSLGFYSVSLSGFDLRSLAPSPAGVGQAQFAVAGVDAAGAALSTGLILNNTNDTDDGHTYQGAVSGFLIRFRNVDNGDGSFFSVSPDSSQYMESTGRNTEAHGVVLDPYGRAYVAGTVSSPFSGPNNIDTSVPGNEYPFRTTSSAITDANASINGRLLRFADAFVRIYGDYGTGGRNSLEYSTLVGGDGEDAAGGVAASLAHTILYTGAPFAVDANGSVFLTGTVYRGSFPHKGTGLGNGFTPPGGTGQGVASDVFVVKIDVTRPQPLSVLTTANAPTSSSLPIAAVLGTGSRTLNGGDSANTGRPVPIGNPLLKSVEPAGIVLDKSGNVYITGNIRPSGISFSTTFAVTNDVTGSNASSIPTTSNALSSTYTLNPTVDPTGGGVGPMPTTEAFVTVLTADLSTLQFSSYVGGLLDDMLYAPTIYSVGTSDSVPDQLILCGWTDGDREYNLQTRTSPPYTAYGDLPTAFVPNTYKNIDRLSPQGGTLFNLLSSPLVAVNPFGYAEWSTFGEGGAISAYTTARDGFLTLLSGIVPAPAPITLSLAFKNGNGTTVTSIDPVGTATATVTLSAARSSDTVLEVDYTAPYKDLLKVNGVQFSNTSGASVFYVTVPAGTNTVSFPVQSLAYAGTFSANFTAYQVDSVTRVRVTPPVTVSGSLTVNGLNYSLSLATTTRTLQTATITLINPSPLANSDSITFDLLVPDTTSNRAVFPGYVATGSGTLRVGRVTVLKGQSTGTTTIAVNPSVPTQVTVLAVVSSVSPSAPVYVSGASAQVVLSPASITSFTATPTTVRGGVNARVTFTVSYDGAPADTPTLTIAPSGAFTTPTLVSTSSDGRTFTFTAFANRVSRSQDVSVTASDSNSGTSASVTVTVLR